VGLPDHTPVTDDALHAIARRHGLEARRLVPLAQTGIINANYALGRHHVLRVPRNHPAHVEQLHHEALAVPAARAAGARTPALVALDDTLDVLPVPYAIYERVPGRSLGLLHLEPVDAAEVWRAFGRDLARVHIGVPSSGPAGLRSRLAASRTPPDPRELVERHATAGWFGSAEARWLTCWLDRLAPEALTPLPHRLLHGDAQDSNVLVRLLGGTGRGRETSGAPAYAAVLDWGCAHWGDPAQDLACGPLRAAPHLLAGHRDVAPLDGDETAEARILWHHLWITLDMLPRGAAPGWAWAERPVARLMDTLRFFLETPDPHWAALAPRPQGAAQ
jgi:aminoglycoside phosphotransferase (APT) family kinase protein